MLQCTLHLPARTADGGTRRHPCRDLLTSATGQAWQAQLSEPEVDQAIKWQDRSPSGGMDALAIGELKQRPAEIRAAGYSARQCLNNESNRSTSVALPAFSEGRVTFVVTPIYFQAAMKQDVAIGRYLRPLRDTVMQIEAALQALVADPAGMRWTS